MLNRTRWIVPVLPKNELETLLDASISLCRQNLDTKSEHCQRFFRDGLMLSFIKVFTDEAVTTWKYDIYVTLFKQIKCHLFCNIVHLTILSRNTFTITHWKRSSCARSSYSTIGSHCSTFWPLFSILNASSYNRECVSFFFFTFTKWFKSKFLKISSFEFDTRCRAWNKSKHCKYIDQPQRKIFKQKVENEQKEKSRLKTRRDFV